MFLLYILVWTGLMVSGLVPWRWCTYQTSRVSFGLDYGNGIDDGRFAPSAHGCDSMTPIACSSPTTGFSDQAHWRGIVQVYTFPGSRGKCRSSKQKLGHAFCWFPGVYTASVYVSYAW